jgi:polyhydroxyalkanoate synthesis regulator phasin
MNRIPRASLAVGTAIALLVGLGAVGALAANGVLSPQEESAAIIDDAAAQLGVEPDALSSALEDAMKNRVDAAVDAGMLTEEQATELKERIDSGNLPLLGPGVRGPGFHGHGPGHLGRGEVFAAAAAYLGLTEAELRTQLEDGTLADVATAEGKSVSGLVDAMVAAAEKSIDEAVAAGKLTEEQASLMKAGLEEHLTARVNGELGPRGMRGPMSESQPGGFRGPAHPFQGPPA